MADCIKIRKRHVQILSNLENGGQFRPSRFQRLCSRAPYFLFVAVNFVRIKADVFHASAVYQFFVWFYFSLLQLQSVF